MKFGVKVVDKTSTKNQKTLNKYMDYYKKLDGLELAIYNNSNEYIHGVNYHILHTETKKFSIEKLLFETQGLYDYIYYELIPLLMRENIKNIVVHILPGAGLEKYNDVQIKEFVDFCADLSEAEDINIFLENTFNNVKEMEKIFKMDKNYKLNFCFDIGHAKALSKEDTFSSWLKFINGFYGDTHIHFHTNRGLKDEHLPLTVTTNKWTSPFHEGRDYFQMAAELINTLGEKENSSLIMETYPAFMKNHISAFKKLGIIK